MVTQLYPLYQEIPLLRDTLLRVSTVLSTILSTKGAYNSVEKYHSTIEPAWQKGFCSQIVWKERHSGKSGRSAQLFEANGTKVTSAHQNHVYARGKSHLELCATTFLPD